MINENENYVKKDEIKAIAEEETNIACDAHIKEESNLQEQSKNETNIKEDIQPQEEVKIPSITNVNMEENNVTTDEHVKVTIPVIEQRSSIFNSKVIISKTELESFYEQNTLLQSIYDDRGQPDDEDNFLLIDEKNDFPSNLKSNSKFSNQNEKLSPEKQLKRKKHMSHFKRELDIDLTHSIFNKEIIPEPIKKEEEPKFPYKPLNKEKEDKYEKFCEQ